MQTESGALQAPQVIIRPIERGAAVHSNPSQEQVRVFRRYRYSLSARTVEVERVHTLNDEHGDSTNDAADNQPIHALSIQESYP